LNETIAMFEASGLGTDCERDCVANAHGFREEVFQDGVWAALSKLGISHGKSQIIDAEPCKLAGISQ